MDEVLADIYVRWLERHAPEEAERNGPLLARLLQAMSEGHVCLDVGNQVAVGGCIGAPGDYQPLILDRGLLYTARFHDHESRVATSLSHLAGQLVDAPSPQWLQLQLARLFPDADAADRQRLAVLVAQYRRLTLISGGPGTGKTSTVVNLLAVLLASNPALRVVMAAPTGKAAQRMVQAVSVAKRYLRADPDVVALIPEEAGTLHRLLGVSSAGGYRFNPENPLPVDVVVVDEASMIDLALMRALLDALPETGRLVMLGDRDQLASVEAGSVFGDLCAFSGRSVAFEEQLSACGIPPDPIRAESPLADCRIELTRSFRFTAESGIGQLAACAREGDAEGFLRVIANPRPDIAWDRNGATRNAELAATIRGGLADYLAAVAAGNVADAFAAFDRFRVLAAHRRGRLGVEGLNSLIASLLFPQETAEWYAGRPVMITCNDYGLRLFNGDIGLCLQSAEGLWVYFQGEPGQWRQLAPGRLPAHETAFAMTVHKSQGSEFDQVVLVLPDAVTPVLNRPLVYTAITRARKQFLLWGREEVLIQALAALPQRSSGLRERLRQPFSSTDQE